MAEIADLLLDQLAGSRSDSGESESPSDSGDDTGDPEEDCWTSCDDDDHDQHHDHYHRYQGTNRGRLAPMFSPRSDSDSDSDSNYPEVREPPGSVRFRFPDSMLEDDLRSDLSGLGLGFGDEDHHVKEKAYWSEDEEGEGFFLEDSVRNCGNEGLRIVEFGSGSDEDDESVELEDASFVHNQWDCLRDDEFEWEEVDDDTNGDEGVGGMLTMHPEEERTNVQNGEMTVDDDDDVEEEEYDDSVEEDDDDENMVNRNVEWEVLLSMRNLNLERNYSLDHTDFESYVEGGDQDQDQDEDGFVYTSEDDEILFGQFADHEISIKGSPPTARSVVDNLPSIVLSQEDIERNNTLCAVCKNEFLLGESVKQLPCLHHYHGDCILPWLGMRNTCPICRYELPSDDDTEYESIRARRANTGL